MDMLVSSLGQVDVDVTEALKANFIANALDGSEDIKVKDSIFSIVGKELTKFRETLMAATPPKTLSRLLETITPPEGVRAPSAVPSDEGTELLDGEMMDEEAAPSSTSPPVNPVENSSPPQTSPADQPVSTMRERPLPTCTGNEDMDADAAFLNELGELLSRHQRASTSTSILQHRLV